MLSPVVGFDVGSLTSFIGAAKGGGFEILANEFGDRRTPSCVAFDGKARLLGSAAEQQMTTNVANTITSFSRLIGKMENDPVVNFEREHTFFHIVSDRQGRAAFQVKVNGKPMVLLPEQVLAMHLHKLALVTESNLGTKVVDVVLSVPSYYTDRERNAFLDAARIAGLNCMRLVNETTAIGIAYGYLKKDLPAVGQPSRNVAFVSLGNSNLQVAIVAFNAGKMRVISTAWDPCLGGRDFDMCIFRHLVKEIEKKYNLKVMSNAKACVRLLKSCERLKKIMSTNSTEIPINVECLMEDTDISLKMKREFFEEICRPLLLRVKQTMERALALSTLKLGDLYSVELVGGGTRIPAVKTLVREVFGMEGSTTLNADEAVARGCALQAAICSSTRRFREFSIVDACPYSISLHWKPTDGGVVVGDRDSSEIVKNNSCEIFKHLSSVPASKKLTFYRKSGFDLTASYSHPEGLHIGDSRIGSFLIKDIVPTPPDNCCQVRIEARVNSNGIFTICNACVLERVVEKVEVAIEDPKPEASTVANAIETDMETETQPPKTEGGVEQPPTGGAASGTTETAVANQSPSQPTRRIEKKIVLRPRDVAVKAMTFQLPHTQMDEFANFQARLNQIDELERERQDLMNELTSYVYEMQSKLETCLQQYTTERERDSFNKALTNTRYWICNEGEGAKKSVISDRLKSLKQIGDRYYLRFTEADSRPSAIKALASSCEGVRKVVESYLAGDPRYSHLSKKDMAKVDNTLRSMEHRLNTFVDGVKKLHPTSDPTFFVADLYDAQKKLEEICNPIILKPKPAPPPPPPKPASPESDKTTSVPDGDIHEMALLKRKMKEIEKLLGEKVLELDRAEERVASLKAEHKRNVYETTEAKVKLETELTNMKSDLAKARTFAQRAERMAMQANHEKEAQISALVSKYRETIAQLEKAQGEATQSVRETLNKLANLAKQLEQREGGYHEIGGLAEAEYLPPTASANVSIIFRGFKQEKAFECKITSFNLTFYTNASSFHIPFTLYDAKLKILSPSAETSDDALTFDIFDVGSQYTRSLYISNPNPIAVVIQRLLVDSPAGSLCVSLAQLRQHSGLFCHHHGHHHQGSEVEVILMSGRNCNSEPLTLQPSSWMHFSIIFNQEQVDSATEWVLTVESKLVSISKLLRFRVPAKVLTMEPSVLDLGSVFPGKPLSQDILVPSSLARPEEVTSLEFHSIHGMPSFRVDLSHVAGVTWVNLEPNRTTLMGVLSYNAWLGCREILAASTTSGFENDDASARVCYAGFEVGSAKGGYWFASNFFPFLKDEGLPNHGVTSTPSSGIAFFPGLRFSASLFTQLRNAWRSLTRRIHVATVGVAPFIAEPTEECKVIGRVAIHSIDKEPSFVGRLVANLIWPRILSERVTYEKANAKSTPSSSPCHLNFQFGSTEGLAQLWIQNLVTEVVTCRLTLINPTEKPLIIQPILLDDLLPLNMNYTEMVEQMPSLTAELFSAAHVPQHLAKFPRHPSQRTGRFTSYRDTAKFDDDSLASLRSVLHYHSLQNVVLPTCCPVYVLPPKGGEVTYLITFTPGAFHNESIGYNHHPKFDNSLLLLRNNLTALETVLLQTVTRTAVVGVRSGLLPIDSSSHTTEGSERSFTTFPTATGLAFDAAVSFNPLLVNPACESTPLAGIVDVARYDLRSESGNALCPVAAASERNLSLCRVSATLLNNSIPDGALFSFTFNEGHLRSLCSDGAVHPRPSITRFLEGLKSAFPFNFFRLSNSQSSQSSMESSRFSSPLQLAWAMDEDGMPIFSSEFISGLVLSRRIALFNPGSLSVWIMRVGFKQPGSAGYTSALGQCDPHLYGFSVALCDSDVMATSTRSRHKTADGALREFELKPGEQRWLEVLYSPDFLHTEVNVELCLFASLLAPSTGRPVWLSKRMMELEPVIGDFRSSSSSLSSFSTFSSSVACNANSVNECSVFQLDSIKLSAKIPSPLTRLCHSSLIRPPFEDNLWSLLLFVFASNLAGIFVAASFDAIRLLSFHESCRQVTAPVTTTANANSDSDQQSSSQLFSLNFNLPVFEHQHQQQDHQQQNNSLSPCLRVVGATTSQPASDDTYCRRRSCRTLASEMADRQQGDKYSTFGIARTVAKSLVRGLRAAATGAGRAVYLPLTRGLGMVGKRWSSALSPLRSQTAEVERSGRAAMRRVMKSSIETSSAVRNQQHQGQNRRGGAENAESVGTLANPRKSSDEVKRTAKQSAVRTNGEILSSSLSNNTQVCSDGTTTAVWTNQSAIGGCIKNRGGGGAKHNALGTVPGELQASLRAAATAMTGGGALKKNSLSNSTNTSVSTTTPSSPKMRTAKSSASLGTPPPPTPPPPPPSLIMESIKVESASMGVKKPRQFGHQQQQQQLSKTTAAVAALIPQSQGSCRPSGQRYNSSKEASLPKQKSPLAGAIDTVASESLAQRKKSAKPMAPTKLSSINTTATGTAASLPPWQTRKASAPIEVQCSDQWRQPSASEPVENEVGSSGLASHAGRPTTAWAGVSRSEGAAAAPRLTTNHLGDLEFPPLGSAVARRSVKTVPVAGGGKILLSPELSRLVTETSEFDRQMRCLPPNTHRFHNATNWDDITQHLRQHPQHHFSARYCIPHATSSLLSTPRGQYTTPMAHRHHRPCLYNASYPMTTMPCPPSSSSTYCHSTNTAPTATEYASHGYTYLQHQQNPFEPVVFSGTSVNDLHVNSRDHRRRRSSTGQIFTSAEKPTATTTTTTTDSAVATDDQELANLMLFSSHKSDMGLTSILPKMDGDVVAVVEEGSSADERFCPPEWLNAFDTSPPPPLQTTTGATVQGTSAPPCELEQLTATRRRWMLMHEQRGRMRSEETDLGFESNDFPLLDCEHLVPSTPMNSRPTLGSQLDDPFLHKNKSNVAFDKTVGGQLTNAIPAVGVTPSSQAKTPQALPDAFGMFQKTWLPAFLPWRSRFSTEDPTRDPDFAEATLYFSSCQPDIPGPIIQEVTEPTTASDDSSKSVEDISDEMGQLTEVRAGQMLPCHDVSDDKRT